MIARVTSSTTIYRRDDKKNGIVPKTFISTLYYISSLEYNDENCLQFVHSHNDRWLYESHHNTIDTALLQDQQHCCDENHLASIIGLKYMAYNILSFTRQDLSKHSGVKHHNQKTASRAKLKSYNNVVSLFKGNPLLALDYLFKFLETPPVESELLHNIHTGAVEIHSASSYCNSDKFPFRIYINSLIFKEHPVRLSFRI